MSLAIQKIESAALAEIEKSKTLDDLAKVEHTYFGRKEGKITVLSKSMKDKSDKEKKTLGEALFGARKAIELAISEKKLQLSSAVWDAIKLEEAIDVTARKDADLREGHIHPISQARKRLTDVAQAMGFQVEDGPEVESDYFSFQALNIPDHHPARDSQDTFYIKGHEHWCMRPHVSNMQVRMLQKYGAPLQIVYPGRVYRNEALDATHEHTFTQFEGLFVDKHVSVSQLIGLLKEFVFGLYGQEMNIRLRPGYFPFVEPGFELDIEYQTPSGKKWMEMLGCGLVHPEVLREAGLDPEEYQGLAFGMGLDRLVMLKYGIDDIRHIHGNDARFLTQF